MVQTIRSPASAQQQNIQAARQTPIAKKRVKIFKKRSEGESYVNPDDNEIEEIMDTDKGVTEDDGNVLVMTIELEGDMEGTTDEEE